MRCPHKRKYLTTTNINTVDLIMAVEGNVRELIEKDNDSPQITEDSFVELMSSSSEDDDNLDPVHFLPEGGKALKEYEKAAKDKRIRRKAEPSSKRTAKPKVKLSEIDPKELLLKAAEKGRIDLVEFSLDRDPSLLHATDVDGYTGLHRAAYNGHLQVVRALLMRGADVAARTIDGWMPLHNACRWGQTAVASILLQNGADINSQTAGLQTPLHLAATAADGRSTLELLLSNRLLDASLCNRQGETAFDIARRSGMHYELFEMVEDCVNVR